MPVRDIILFALIAVGIPHIVRHPYIGALAFVWLGIMNPHRLTWGPAYGFPFSMLVVALTLIGFLFTKDEWRFKTGPEIWVLLLFVIWMSVTLVFALNPDPAFVLWKQVMKIQFMIFVSLFLFSGKRHVDLLAWVMALSVAYFGVKGGIFTLVKGGEFRVWGPSDSFISDNNALALALVMTIPLLNYLRTQTGNKWIRRGLVAAMVLCGVSVLGSHSRGALLAIFAMLMLLWWRSRTKVLLGLALIVMVPPLIALMPAEWASRMESIRDYEQDTSANQRFNAWNTAINVTKDRPLNGGGFVLNTYETFAQYAPDPTMVHNAHSIYFQVLGEHGYVGLGLFLLLGMLTWRSANKLIAAGRKRPNLHWASQLGAMIQVSLVGYAVGGTFLNLAYWDFPYYEIVLIVVARDAVKRALSEQVDDRRESVASDQPPAAAVSQSAPRQ